MSSFSPPNHTVLYIFIVLLGVNNFIVYQNNIEDLYGLGTVDSNKSKTLEKTDRTSRTRF